MPGKALCHAWLYMTSKHHSRLLTATHPALRCNRKCVIRQRHQTRHKLHTYKTNLQDKASQQTPYLADLFIGTACMT